jgi:hypothetical protein
MSGDQRQITLQRLQEMPDLREWVAVHEREVAAFERRLRKVDPRAWQEEFVRVVLQSVEHEERD